MINSLSLFLLMSVTVVTVFSENFWQDKYTAQYYGKMTRVLFGGKLRSLITSHMFLLIGIGLVSFFDSEIAIYEIISIYLVSEVFIFGAAIGIYMNFRIGSYSFAPRHKFLVEGLVRMYIEDELDTFYLKTVVESLTADARLGNSVSFEILKSLHGRADALGFRVKELIPVIDFESNVIENHLN